MGTELSIVFHLNRRHKVKFVSEELERIPQRTEEKKKEWQVRFQVLTAASTKMAVFFKEW
jgi:hypothetical protein